jgi:putative membrane protein
MDRLLIRLVINAAAIYLAIGTGWISGIHAENTSGGAILALAFVFTVVNAMLRPLLKLLTCPLIVLTLGLFTLLINTFLFWLTGQIGTLFPGGFGYTFDNFWAAFLGALVVSVVNGVLTLTFKDELKPEKDTD